MKHHPSILLRFLSGVLLIAIVTAVYLWVRDIRPNIRVYNSAAIAFAGYVLAAVSVDKLVSFPGRQTWLHILPTVAFAYGSVFALSAFFFLLFSNSFVLACGLFTLLFFAADYYLRTRRRPVMVYIPVGRAGQAHAIPDADWLRLDAPVLPEKLPVRAVVADLHSPDLGAEWQRFLADCTLRGIAVYNIRQVEESLTGRVKIRHLYENDLGSLLPSPSYMLAKRVADTLFVLLTLPVSLPLMAATALAVRLESEGPVLFVQNRVGQGGREFRIYKFRSMRTDSEQGGAKLAQQNDDRITRVGRFIRKTRLDELPQFFNILKGDMSLIGPRPEQKAFVERFEQSIPFYGYRHIVKPGLSGWAQVTQGYAGNEDETQLKIEHDFYYIKHFSLSLDILIIFKTLKTVLTGFGAR